MERSGPAARNAKQRHSEALPDRAKQWRGRAKQCCTEQRQFYAKAEATAGLSAKHCFAAVCMAASVSELASSMS